MATSKHKTTPKGRALFEVLMKSLKAGFLLRDAGKRMGAVTPWGGGLWGMLRSLKRDGPQTVPQLARARPVSRQRIQRLANDMVADGLIEFVDNPAHKRSKLARLTAKGESAYDDLTDRLTGLADALALDMDLATLVTTAKTLDTVCENLQRRRRGNGSG